MSKIKVQGAYRPIEDLTGRKFHRWTVVRFYRMTKDGESQWLCRCKCSAEAMVCRSSLTSGNSKSCGCYKKEQVSIRFKTHGATTIKNRRGTPEFWAWSAMICRCHKPKTKLYHHYGGRGISVCVRWRHSFENFLEDMGLRPSRKHSLDRYPNNNGNYEPENCRWATQKQQMNNTRCNVVLHLGGESATVSEWAEITGKTQSQIRWRIAKGWSVEDVLTKPTKC